MQRRSPASLILAISTVTFLPAAGFAPAEEGRTLAGRLEVDRNETSIALFVRDGQGIRHSVIVPRQFLVSHNGLSSLEGKWVKVSLPTYQTSTKIANHLEIVTRDSANRDPDPIIHDLVVRHSRLDSIGYRRSGPLCSAYHAMSLGLLGKDRVTSWSKAGVVEIASSPTIYGPLASRVYIGNDAHHYYLVSSASLLGQGTGIRVDEVQEDAYAVGPGGRMIDRQVKPLATRSGSLIGKPGDLFVAPTMQLRVESAGSVKALLSFRPFTTNSPWIVTNTKDSGPGSLRDALTYHNANATQQIVFNIPTSDPGFNGKAFTIHVTSQLPPPVAGTVLDGAQQRAFSGATNGSKPEIFIDGSNADASANGYTIQNNHVFVNELGFGNFQGSGIFISSTSATIQRCFIGLGADGTTATTNKGYGLYLSGASSCRIGGTAAQRNAISGNTSCNIYLTGSTKNLILGNYVGCNAAGTAAEPNAIVGIDLENGSNNNQIGSPVTGEGNLVSGHTNYQIFLNAASNNIVASNKIGTNASGSASISNGTGIFVGGDHNQIGGAGTGQGNLISGCPTGYGVVLGDQGCTANMILGNRIGTNAAGTAALANGAGMLIYNGAHANQIGGGSPGQGNLISGNAAEGIDFLEATATQNLVLGNRIGTTADGGAALPNKAAGIQLQTGAHDNIIGGVGSGMGNLISGNGGDGIAILSSDTNGTQILGNRIGMNASGNGAIPNNSGISIRGASKNTVIGSSASGGGNYIGGNTAYGILLLNTSKQVVQGNTIGVSPTGAVLKNSAGVYVQSSSSCMIGGSTPGQGNLISGNSTEGIVLTATGTTGNVIQGNILGLNASLTAAIPNQYGIEVTTGADGNTIGGPGGAGNVICGNTVYGVVIGGAIGTSIQGNSIGATSANVPFGNLLGGIDIGAAAQNTLIGTLAANLINANGDGVVLEFAASGTKLYSNRIGVATNGTPLPNLHHQVVLASGAFNNQIGAYGGANNIGGAGGTASISVTGSTTVINIDLVGNDGPLGVTPNDSLDSDSGPNQLQNFPVVSTAVVSNGQATITGSLNSTPNTVFTIDLFSVLAVNGSAHGGSQRYIGTVTVTTNASGNTSFSKSLTVAGAPYGVCAQAVDPTGNSSEMSLNKKF